MEGDDRKTTPQHWERVWQLNAPRTLPSPLDVSARNVQRLLRRDVKPGMRYLEIGCAPGRLLAWVAIDRKARVAGLDYSPVGITAAEELFRSLALDVDLRCEDVFGPTFAPESFDVVTSFGLIEHFDDPAPVVHQHVMLTKPGGLSIVVVPNYGGIYRRLQGYFDPENLAIHNLAIMDRSALAALAPAGLVHDVRVYSAGRVAPGLVSFETRWPAFPAKLMSHVINLAGHLQPFDVTPLCPLLVLEMRKKGGLQ